MKKYLMLIISVCSVFCGYGANGVVLDYTETSEAIRLRKKELAEASLGVKPATSATLTRSATILTSSSPVRLEITSVSQVEGTRGSETLVDVYYNLLGTTNQCEVSAQFMTNGVPVPSYNLSGDVGVGVHPGEGKRLRWAAGRDYSDAYSEKFQVRLSVTEMIVPAEWAKVSIEWSTYGGKDVDICAYWSDEPEQCAGYGYGYPEATGYPTLIWPSKDNIGSGPETVHCDVGGLSRRRLYIHFNYFRTSGNPPNVKVVAKNNGVTRSMVSAAGVRNNNKASKSDPGVVIVFDEKNTPVSISSL